MEKSAKENKKIYNKKFLLQAVYNKWYTQVREYIKPGDTLEIGSGFGLAKNYIDCVTSDIKKNEFVERQEDACKLTCGENSLDNIIGIDVLHHLSKPDNFFSEANRVLKANGRIVLIEPYISKFSYIIRKMFHHENLDLTGTAKTDQDPDQSNLALPTIMFSNQNFINNPYSKIFKVVELKNQDIIAYPLSLGFKRINLIPKLLVNPIMKLDSYLAKNKFINNFFSFKMLIVLEKYK